MTNCILCGHNKTKRIFSLAGATYECKKCGRKFNIYDNGEFPEEIYVCNKKGDLWVRWIRPEKVVFT